MAANRAVTSHTRVSTAVSAQITVTVAGDERSVAEGTTAADLFADDRSVVVARVGDQLVDLAHVLHDGDAVDPVTIDTASTSCGTPPRTFSPRRSSR